MAAAGRVLILVSEFPGSPGGHQMVAGIEEALSAARPGTEVSSETLDTTRFSEPDYEAALARMLAVKYESTPPSLMIAIGKPALDLVARRRRELFPSAPVLCGFIDESMVRGRDLGPNTFAVFSKLDVAATVRLAKSLFPHLRQIVVIGGASDFDRGWLDVTHADLDGLELPLAVRYVSNVPFKTALGEIGGLGDDAAVLYLSMAVDGAGASYQSLDLVPVLRRATDVPIFGLSSSYLGRGIIGGALIDFDRHGRELGARAASILNGDVGANAAPTTTAPILEFDARELRRHGIPESVLPRGSVVRFTSPGFLSTYRTQLVAATALLLAAVLIAGVVVEMQRRRRSEETLASERTQTRLIEDLLVAFATVPMDRLEATIESALAQVAKVLGADRIVMWEKQDSDDMAWAPLPLQAGETVELHSSANYPEALRTKLAGEDLAGRTVTAIPLRGNQSLLGALLWVGRGPISQPSRHGLAAVSETFANVLQRRRADLAIERSERLKRSVLSSLAPSIVVLDPRGTIIEFNDAWKQFGRANGVTDVASIVAGANYRRLCETGAFPGLPRSEEALAGIDAVCAGRSQEFHTEYRADGSTGERWYLLRVTALLTDEGGAVVSHLEVTEQKRAERVLHTLSGRLIRAQEEERRRISRDLHDDIGQRVALLGMEIEQAAMASDAPMSERIRALGERAAEVATEIHRLSHTLHSAKLDALGLVAAVRGHCRELKSAGLDVAFSDETVVDEIPPDVALCVFRVVQEALNNVLKHAGTDTAEVQLLQEDHSLTARIVDGGRGFDVSDESELAGIGLVGMRERLAASGGTLKVFSRPGVGTVVEASVPL